MSLFKKSKILIIGDAMLDKYFLGSTERISPEAPVPVLKVESEILKPGGAANVASNISSLGQDTTLIANIGIDTNGKILKKLIGAQKINLISKNDKKIKTTTKSRFISQNQQLIRVDDETNDKINFLMPSNIESQVKKCDALIFSDYKKGAQNNITKLIKLANKFKKPVFIDPKGDNFDCYKNSFCITPNRKEFENIVGKCSSNQDIVNKSKKLITKLNLKSILITLGSEGMILVEKNLKPTKIEATSVNEVFDVTGAGDTVIATLCATYLSSETKDLKFAAVVANIAAGEVIKKLGAQSISEKELSSKVYENLNLADEIENEYFSKLDELENFDRVISNERDLTKILNLIRELGFKIGFTNGCFDILHRGHIQYLDKARKSADFLFIGVNDDNSVKKLKGKNRPINSLKDRINFLNRATLDDAFIMKFSESTPLRLIKRIKPDILIKGGDYKANQIVGNEFVKKNNGEVKIIPFLKGYSTSNLIKKIKKSIE
ncbi:MAG: bifunctional heptose 7-phosphate kinase/heptose 1-phosphate adenyltransferase [Gammaproteobacteria bacterium]|jgi:D-beta-D-heptose 7-phosphate kinase/D-beta-D-heptose 1-phosphate adenosyltransferase|nr:bifunctional heptose 7-phosphate kinase/heptose 1-phosphate adenyltransferase [Gammaproteobacteria bacterium]|tara:strand:- start:844 stop:2322 length:1479 start_codon:yes stop_codon:yes gene_type:complete